MTQISLGELKTYWQNVSDWVKGVDTTSKPKVTTGASVNDVVFHDNVVAIGDGTTFTVGSFKTLTIEIYGTSTSREVKFYGLGVSGTKRPIQGVKLLDYSMSVNTLGNGELWQFDITGLNSVIMEVTSIAGGNVSVKGKAVA